MKAILGTLFDHASYIILLPTAAKDNQLVFVNVRIY
jgi:hypothetical protein